MDVRTHVSISVQGRWSTPPTTGSSSRPSRDRSSTLSTICRASALESTTTSCRWTQSRSSKSRQCTFQHRVTIAIHERGGKKVCPGRHYHHHHHHHHDRCHRLYARAVAFNSKCSPTCSFSSFCQPLGRALPRESQMSPRWTRSRLSKMDGAPWQPWPFPMPPDPPGTFYKTGACP